MAPSRHSQPEGRSGSPDHDVRDPAADERVLAEISHELGNFFHKLYYWSDHLKERWPEQVADSTAPQMLERTLRNLEDFLRVSLDYFHPMRLSLMRMASDEVAQALLQQVRGRLNGTPVRIAEVDGWKTREILIDPGQLSRAFEVAVRRLTQRLGATSTLRVDLAAGERGGRTGLEMGLVVEAPKDASSLFETSEAGVEWAVAQKVIASHGGDLAERVGENDGAAGGSGIVLFLPLCPESTR